MRYDDASNAGSTAADNAPVARPDVDSVAAGGFQPATGNAISGAGTVSGAAGADTVGDAPGKIVEVHGAGGATTMAGDSFQATGQYGVLSMSAQGDFNYVRNPGTPEGVEDVFGYTLADRDGGTSSTTLTINVGQTPAQAALALADGAVTLPGIFLQARNGHFAAERPHGQQKGRLRPITLHTILVRAVCLPPRHPPAGRDRFDGNARLPYGVYCHIGISGRFEQ
jgi:hypothetical protein